MHRALTNGQGRHTTFHNACLARRGTLIGDQIHNVSVQEAPGNAQSMPRARSNTMQQLY